MNLVIRPINKEEVEEAQRVADSVMGSDFPEYDPVKKPRILLEDLNISDRIQTPLFVTWVALIDGKIIGVISGLGPVCEVLMIHWILSKRNIRSKVLDAK